MDTPKNMTLEAEKRQSFASGSMETISAIRPVFNKMLAALKETTDLIPLDDDGTEVHIKNLEIIKEADELGL